MVLYKWTAMKFRYYLIYLMIPALFACESTIKEDEDLEDQTDNCVVSSNESREAASNPVFQEGFEYLTIDEMLDNWDNGKNTKDMSFSDDVPEGSSGKQALMMTYVVGKNSGGHLFKELPEGYDSLYARFYVKFLTRKSPIHHFVKIGGYNPSVPGPQGLAGMKPQGDDFFISGIESPSIQDWNWGFYTYWMHMHGRPNAYYGNVFYPENQVELALDQWICVEFMIKLNDPVEAINGEMAFWIDGEKILHLGDGFPMVERSKGHYRAGTSASSYPFPGFQWRNCDQLKISFFWLNYYMTKGNEGDIDKVLFDDVKLSTQYIGPHEL